MGSESERLIYEKLCSNDLEVESFGLKELDQLSRENRIRDENLLAYMTNKERLKCSVDLPHLNKAGHAREER